MKKRILPLFIALFTLVFVACEKDEENKELTTEEAKLALTTASVSVEAEMTEMQNHQAVKAMESLENLGSPIGTDFMLFSAQQVKSGLKNPVEALKANKKKEGEQQTFAELVGTYTYNASVDKWEPQYGTPSDKIIFIFPTEGSTTNNAVWTIHNWEQTEITYQDWGMTYSYMETTKLVSDILVNNEKVLDLNFTATWSTDGEPESIDYTFEATPYLQQINLRNSGENAEFAVYFKKSDVTLASFSLQATMGAEGEPSSISGHAQYGTIKVAGEVNFAGMASLEETMVTSVEDFMAKLNEHIKVEVVTFPENQKIGDLQFDFVEGAMEPTVVIVFADGTKEPAEQYLDGILEQLEGLFGDFLEEEGDDFMYEK